MLSAAGYDVRDPQPAERAPAALAFTGGVLPFLPGAAVKTVAAALIVTLARARLKAI